MEAHDDLTVAGGTTSTPDLAAIQRVYERIAAGGAIAGIEELLTISHEDIEMRPYTGTGPSSAGGGQRELLRGPEEIREFFQTSIESGFKPQLRAKAFDVVGDSVVVRGSIRLTRPGRLVRRDEGELDLPLPRRPRATRLGGSLARASSSGTPKLHPTSAEAASRLTAGRPGGLLRANPGRCPRREGLAVP